jgi:hypothetical protein
MEVHFESLVQDSQLVEYPQPVPLIERKGKPRSEDRKPEPGFRS